MTDVCTDVMNSPEEQPQRCLEDFSCVDTLTGDFVKARLTAKG